MPKEGNILDHLVAWIWFIVETFGSCLQFIGRWHVRNWYVHLFSFTFILFVCLFCFCFTCYSFCATIVLVFVHLTSFVVSVRDIFFFDSRVLVFVKIAKVQRIPQPFATERGGTFSHSNTPQMRSVSRTKETSETSALLSGCVFVVVLLWESNAYWSSSNVCLR